MPIATTAEQRAAADAISAWARGADLLTTVRAQERDPSAWQRHWAELTQLGLCDVLAAGGTITDLAVLLEQCAAVLAPGPVLGSALASAVIDGEQGAVALAMSPVELTADGRLHGVTTVLRAGAGAPILLPAQSAADERWFTVADDAPGVKLVDRPGADLSRPIAELRLDGVRRRPGRRPGTRPGHHADRGRGSRRGRLVPAHRGRVRQGA